MTDKQKLEQKLWNIADTLRGKMGADEYKDYVLGFIFYKYLSEKMLNYANRILEPDNLSYTEINTNSKEGQLYLDAVRKNAIGDVGYFLEPGELFSTMVLRGNGNGKTKADFPFVQHMVYQLNDTGTMACVLPHGVLFRGGAEGHIREYLIKDRNYLNAVIGLPSNIFYGTSIPTCILVLKKQRTHAEHVLFIDASEHYEKVKTQNKLRPEDIAKIIDTYREFENHTAFDKKYSGVIEDKYSYIANRAEIAENDCNLNIPRYVDTFEEEEPVDLKAVAKEIKALDADMEETDAIIADFCKELGIETPF